MWEAGLTVGVFYKHFKSRDGLVAEALGSALEAWKHQVKAAASGGPRDTYQSLVDDYLGHAHRDHPGAGRPVSALAGDIARTDKRTRAVASRQIRDNIELIAALLCDATRKAKSEQDQRTTRSRDPDLLRARRGH